MRQNIKIFLKSYKQLVDIKGIKIIIIIISYSFDIHGLA